MKRKRYRYIKATHVELAKRLRHRAACRRYKLRCKLGIKLNRPRMSKVEFERWLQEA